MWAERRLNLTEKIIELCTHPLVLTPPALIDQEKRRQFRDFAEPLWLLVTLLHLNSAQRRLGERVTGKPTLYYCPVLQCRKTYKLRTRLNDHLYKHRQFRELPPSARDDVLHEMSFLLPVNCGLHDTILSTNESTDQLAGGGATRKRSLE